MRTGIGGRVGWVVVWAAVLAGLAQAGTIYYISTTGHNANDGLTWATARQTVQAGLNAAASGDQVWVAAGTYVGCITLRDGVGLYGGFAGTETDLSQRDWTANDTVLDGNQAGSVVTAPVGATTATRIDGFTIRNGAGTLSSSSKCGGGIYCLNASPTIANNIVTANDVTNSGGYSYGGGIFCEAGSPVITGNTVTGNNAGGGNSFGGGIFCHSGSPTIANNSIVGNSGCYGAGIDSDYSNATIVNNAINGNAGSLGSGILCGDGSTSVIANNTIIGNTGYEGGGIYCDDGAKPTITNDTIVGNSAYKGGGLYISLSASPAVVNTIIAFNSSGIDASGTKSLRCNCLYGNGAYDFSGPTSPIGKNGNISRDPRLAGGPYGNTHIQPDSPCVDAGDDSVVQAGWVDVDGQGRKAGAHVDIGADESDGTLWATSAIVRVSPVGNDANDGSSWGQAKRTVQGGIDAAAVLGGEVWVAAGTYMERITLRNYAHVYGGFAGIEAERTARDVSTHITVLDGGQAGTVVTASRIGYSLSTIDGLTIQNGKASLGGGVYCSYASPVIRNNTITGSSASLGGGVYCSNSLPVMGNNTIARNSAGSGGGIHCTGSPYPTIVSNRIVGNNASFSGGGVYCDSGSPTIANNAIAGNSTSGGGGGIYCYNSSVRITNNTIAANSASFGGGICCIHFSLPSITNTIIGFNSSGLYVDNSGVPLLTCNCVYGSVTYNYSGLADPMGVGGNISQDPLVLRAPNPGADGVWGTADDDYGDLRLGPGSPCIDAGYNFPVPADVADLDGDGNTVEPLPVDLAGNPRFVDDPTTVDTGSWKPVVDIGAYERQHLAGDVNGDWQVDVVDLLWLVDAFGSVTGDANYDVACDFNADGSVDVVDLLTMVESFGK